MNPLKHKLANEWMRQDDASPEEALDTWNTMEAEFKVNRAMAQAPLAEDLEPGSLRDEMLKGFDPSQETHEEYLQRINLDRPFNAAHGGFAGQLVRNTVDGSRPGYSGLPAFVSTDPRSKSKPYRVKVKPNEKLGREGFEGKFSSLKKAKAKAAEFTSGTDVIIKTRNKRYKKIKELVEEANRGSKVVTMKELAEKVGIPSRDQNFARQLKNFNVPKLEGVPDKVQKEFFKIIKNPDLPIEEAFSLVKKISEKTGVGVSKVSEHLLKLPEYKESNKMLKTLAQVEFQKKITGKGFTLGDFAEIIEGKKNVPKLQVSNISTPEKFIIDSAMRHNQQGGDKIKFIKKPGDIDKKGNLITHRDAEFGYKGKRHSYFSLLKEGRKLDDFKEVYKVADEMNDLLGREVVHPKTKETVLFKDLMKESYNKGAGYTYSRAPYDIDHFKSVKDEPFKNLRVIPRRINTSEGILSNLADSAKKGFLPTAGDLYSPERVEFYRKKMGYEFTKDINKLFDDELKLADDILIKGRVLRKPLDIAKDHVMQKIINIGCPGKAAGGRISFDIGGSTACITRGLEKLKNPTNLSPGDQANIRALKEMGKGAKGARTFGQMARLLSKVGIGGELAFGGLFALTDYAGGANKQEILSNFTYGLAGKSMDEQLKEKDELYGRPKEIISGFTSLQDMLKREETQPIGRMSLKPGAIDQQTTVLKEKMQPFMRGPRNEEFEYDLFAQQEAADAKALLDFEKEKAERKLKRDALSEFDEEAFAYRGYAEGGLASLMKKW